MKKEQEQTIRLFVEGESVSCSEQTTYHELAGQTARPDALPAVLALEDGRLRELHHRVKAGAKIRFLTMKDTAGYNAYARSMTLLMLCAASHTGGQKAASGIRVHFAVSGGLYCTMDDPSLLTETFLKKTEEEMHRLAGEKLRIEKRSIPTLRAAELFHEAGMTDKERLMRYRRVSATNVYSLDGYVDYNYGYMLYDTSLLGNSALQLFEEGFVLRYASRENPDSLPAFEPEKRLFAVQNNALQWGESLGISSVSGLNDRIVGGGASGLILTTEAYQEKQIAQIAEQICSDPEKKLVLIAGPSSSGKTTFSHRLSAQLSVYGLTPHPVAVDNYFKNRADTPLNEDGSYNFECLEAIDTEQFNKDMSALLAGECVEMPVFNFKTGLREYKGDTLQLGNRDILVMEGIHCLNDALSYSLPKANKFKIYVSALTQLNVDEHNRIATTDGRLIRRIVRDARTRGTSAENTIAMWPSVRAGEHNYIFPYQETADVMFNSALLYELSVLKIYAEPLLFSVPADSPHYVEAKRLLKFLDYFVPLAPEQIPFNSLVREFIGGGCFNL